MVTDQLVLSYTIVVIDDDAAVRDSLHLLLMAYGHHVHAFGSCQSYFDAKGDSIEADCMVLDLMMPDMNGYAMLHEMAERRAKYPVIVLTAVNDNNTRDSLLAAGAADYLTKPVRSDLLCETIDRVVRERKAGR